MARAVDVTLRTVQRWEDSTNEPRGGQLLLLASVLGLQVDDLYLEVEAA